MESEIVFDTGYLGLRIEVYQVHREHDPPPRDVLEWVRTHVHSRARVIDVAPLRGGITAAMDRITVASPAGLTDVVLRRWPNQEWTKGLVAREASALAALGGSGVPAPELLAADKNGAETRVRCSLTTALTGQPDLNPPNRQSWLVQLATTQAAIHAVPHHRKISPDGEFAGDVPNASPDRYGNRYRELAWLADPGLRAAAREAAAGSLVDHKVLVHGDYQHFNVLWQDGRLTGVVDWPNAGTGHRGSDVGHCRLNLAVLFDATAAGDYLMIYERAAGMRIDRRADLRALLCYDLEWQRFIPRQIAGRAPVDLPGMAGRVVAAVRGALDGIG